MKNINFEKMYEWPLPAQGFVIGLCIFLLIYLFYFFDISSFNRTINQQRAQENNLLVQYTDIVDKQFIVSNEVLELPVLKKMVATWGNKLVTAGDINTLLNNILKIGENNSLQFTLFKTENSEIVGDFYKVPIRIIMNGTFNQVASFVSDVANMPVVVRLNYITLINEMKDEELPKITDKSLSSNVLFKTEIIIEVYEKKKS